MIAAITPVPADFSAARFNMIENQIRPNKVRDERLLAAMETLPREMFVPTKLAGIAYIDESLEVAPGRYLLEPMILARLIESARLKSGDRVLDIAPATGYSTAVMAQIVREVIGLESDPVLQKQASANLSAMNIKNAEICTGSLTEGWNFKAPYNVIFINGSIETIPPALFAQLDEGGKLLAVLRHYGPGRAAHTGEARLYEKVRGVVSHYPLFDANCDPLTFFEAKHTFTF